MKRQIRIFARPDRSMPVFVAAHLFLALAFQCSHYLSAQSVNDDRELEATASLEKGIAFLLRQQADDGIWHSAHYGNLREGAGVTALVLASLAENQSHLPEGAIERMQRAVEVLSVSIDEHGYVANASGPDYADYASALVLEADRIAGLGLSPERRRKLVDYLVRAQLDEADGFQPDSLDYGGWDLTGWMTGHRPTTGTNISVSTFVIAALSHHREIGDVNEALTRAGRWLEGCRNGDGGFHFHPRIDHDGNKAGWSDETRMAALSYGTCTADGLRALVSLGVPADDSRVTGATAWLSRETDIAGVPGFRDDADGETWKAGLRFYYLAALARVLPFLEPDASAARRRSIMESLVESQAVDGSWSNPGARMREDDPLIATSFAIVALQQTLSQGKPDNR
jgi:hypothetical protein